MRETRYGEGNLQYWLFEPEGATSPLPVVVFHHGWSAFSPDTYRLWLEHIVRRGAIVIYPRWQDNLRTPPRTVTSNAIAAVHLAFEELKQKGHATPDLTRFALVGHSMGGIISANMAARASSVNLPQPRAVMLVEPGDTWKVPKGALPYQHIALDDLDTIPEDTLMIVLVGAQDSVAGVRDGIKIYKRIPHLPPENKNYITLRGDRHGTPPLIADHNSPAAANSDQLDAHDYFAFWKLFDALCDAAFYGKNRDAALGNTEAQRFMGNWSDGVPVKTLDVE